MRLRASSGTRRWAGERRGCESAWRRFAVRAPIDAFRMKRNASREGRILDEIIVDAYGPEEQALGWYCYLERELRFPFPARCRATRAISPLRLGERVTVTGMAPEEECAREMFVQIRWQHRSLAVPLSQLEIADLRAVEAATRTAVADWHYWVGQGYEF
jgi:hypothetical protein